MSAKKTSHQTCVVKRPLSLKRASRRSSTRFLYAFDLVELDGDDLRRDPLAVRKATLASVLARAASGLRFNEHVEGADGPLVFAHACKLGLEGIVSKRKDSRYRSGTEDAGRSSAAVSIPDHLLHRGTLRLRAKALNRYAIAARCGST
jgi:ATP dependent DNA ligase domain